MGKPVEIKVKSMNDFQILVENKSFTIAQAIVSSILKNLKSRKKNIHVLSVRCLEEETIFDITLDKNSFSDTLKDNLKYFEENEMYEDCIKISKAIKDLDSLILSK